MGKIIGYVILILLAVLIISFDVYAIVQDPKGYAIFFSVVIVLLSIIGLAVKLIQ